VFVFLATCFHNSLLGFFCAGRTASCVSFTPRMHEYLPLLTATDFQPCYHADQSIDDSCHGSDAQFGNTCYCNSVLQALYFCIPFREVFFQSLRNTPHPQTEVCSYLHRNTTETNRLPTKIATEYCQSNMLLASFVSCSFVFVHELKTADKSVTGAVFPTSQAVLNWAKTSNSKIKSDEDSMLMSLAETFVAISSNKKKFGIYAPKKLIQVPFV
jgi:ubiquitin carboxyl-terminal hydrolase 9/13